MFKQVLVKMRERMRVGKLTISTHAFREMLDDNPLSSDLRHCVFHGEITERQWDENWDEWKYVITGDAVDGQAIALMILSSLRSIVSSDLL